MAAGLLSSFIVSPLSALVFAVCVGCVVAVLKIFRRGGNFKKEFCLGGAGTLLPQLWFVRLPCGAVVCV